MQPNSTVRLGNCALNPGPYTVTFSDAGAQWTAIVNALGDANVYTGLLFIRTDQGYVDIPGYSPTIFNCNYMMYCNPASVSQSATDKWYYAFVTNVEYVNENTARVWFQLDVMQTYMFDYTRRACMVVREHVNDDSIGANIMDEPVGTGEIKVLSNRRLMHTYEPDLAMDEYTAFVFTCDTPTGDAPNRGCLDGNFTGGGVYYYRIDRDENWQNPITEGIDGFLYQMNDNGKASAITAIVLYPTILCNLLPAAAVSTMNDLFSGRTEYNSNYVTVGTAGPTAGTAIDGYTPRNNKLYTYPYYFLRVSNNKDQYHDYRFEFFGATAEYDNAFQINGTIDPSGDIFAYPINYNGRGGGNFDERVGLGGLIQIPWAYNSYQNWLAQNMGSIIGNFISGAAMLIPAAKVAGTAIKTALGVSNGAKAAVSAGLMGTAMPTSYIMGNELRNAFAANAGQMAIGAAAMGGSQIMDNVTTLIDQSRVPDRQMGTATNNTMNGVGFNCFTFMTMGVRAEYAAVIDDFFDMFGYAVNEVKVPNETGRQNWNYVQTQGAQFSGDVPAPYMAQINANYDNGFTFWHSLSAVGNYSLSNSIV